MQTSKFARKKKLTNLQIASSGNQIILFEGKRGDMHIATQVLQERKKLTNLQMANSLFMMGHSMNKFCKNEKTHKFADGKLSFYDGSFYEQDSHHGSYHSVGPKGNCIREPTFRFS
jgi:hypothetical protein